MTNTETAVAQGFTAVHDGRVLRITITKPKRMNALDYDTMVGLGDTFLAVANDPSVRAVVLTGEGKAFCTGADLAASAEAAARGVTPEMTMDAANRVVKAIVDCPVPVIARVKGAAAGVGVGLALAADLVYASADAYLLLAFINIGLMPDGGAAAMIAAAAGRPLANEMALLGERLSAQAAKDANLINDVLSDEDLDAKVEAAAEKIANGPRRALELTKAALNSATLTQLDGSLAAEKVGQIELLQSPDFAEGAMAMLTKRKAVFAE
ncbi:enoyl-CoA hydratase-related protein [Antrihabitans sp. YC2-6]|uniref:enoyl-CoA hydratase-related protein n=1 Tax=Antrihabitans sp. YC2-6 TaxID=2799498 RepID=UPI0018F41C32|nr:enoyl-CoA hydratase-related protein [Antrihabitans sp. YC2-6]MBJ8347522.1 enoyl-CoA hydratase/isomerase family protein [Antrihabitans sp. YC2-6]